MQKKRPKVEDNAQEEIHSSKLDTQNKFIKKYFHKGKNNKFRLKDSRYLGSLILFQ